MVGDYEIQKNLGLNRSDMYKTKLAIDSSGSMVVLKIYDLSDPHKKPLALNDLNEETEAYEKIGNHPYTVKMIEYQESARYL